MDVTKIEERGLVLLGCGRMGSALLEGWLTGGLSPGAVHVIEPNPSGWLRGTGIHLTGLSDGSPDGRTDGPSNGLPDAPAVLLLAVKPQMMGDALPRVTRYGDGGTLVLSIAAGTPISAFERAFGLKTPVVRAMPNTPAAIGRGITALVGNAHASEADLDLSEALMGAVGQTLRLDREDQMDAVTALSGSGPAYVFHLIEAMAAAGEAEGLPAGMALTLARATVSGAAALAADADDPGRLRENVTSPGGTTAAALRVLMSNGDGFRPLLRRAIAAAADRSRELSQ